MFDVERRRAVTAGILMGMAAVGGHVLIPTQRLATLRGRLNLATNIPAAFGVWQQDTRANAALVNPQTQALLDQLYSETLERTYVSPQGDRVMLSIAYGEDQSAPAVDLHYPEVCYPAQGFKVSKQWHDTLQISGNVLRVKRLTTNLAGQRPEPVTYWTMVGDLQSLNAWDKRVAMMRHGLRGEIVDGVLMRVSTVDPDTQHAFKVQDAFVTALIQAMAPPIRQRLTGFSQS
jgi:EpsI family protein